LGEEGPAVTSQFIVGLRLKGKADRVVVAADDALIAALKVKAERPDAIISYVRPPEPAWGRPPPRARPCQGTRLSLFVSPLTFL
jgi:hypothetical protein